MKEGKAIRQNEVLAKRANEMQAHTASGDYILADWLTEIAFNVVNNIMLPKNGNVQHCVPYNVPKKMDTREHMAKVSKVDMEKGEKKISVVSSSITLKIACSVTDGTLTLPNVNKRETAASNGRDRRAVGGGRGRSGGRGRRGK